MAAELVQAHLAQSDGSFLLRRGARGDQGDQAQERHHQAAETHAHAALFPAQLRDAAFRGRRGPVDRHENTGPHGLPHHGQHLHAPQIRNDEEIQRGYGGRIPPEAGGEKRAGQGTDHKE